MLAKGFTLVELMIAIAIIGILYAFALPAYSQFVQQGRRADVQRLILQDVAILERKYTRQGGYPASAGFIIANTDYYQFSYSASVSTEFELTATPIGSQATDECAILSINHKGEKRPDQASCWGK